MSRLAVSSFTAPTSTGNVLSVEYGTVFNTPGMVIQNIYTRADVQGAYSSPASSAGLTPSPGTALTPLALTITPKFLTSLLVLTWQISCEVGNNNVFVIQQDGILITTSGYQGFNNVTGNNKWSGITSAKYDNNDSSTPCSYFIQYAIPAFTTAPRTYTPAIRSSDTSTYTLYLNRTVAAPTDTNETMVSTGTIMEIAQ